MGLSALTLQRRSATGQATRQSPYPAPGGSARRTRQGTGSSPRTRGNRWTSGWSGRTWWIGWSG